MKKISIVASSLLIGNALSAGTISLNEGYNLISIPSSTSINKSNIQYLDSINTFNGINPIPSFMIDTLQPGKAYWVKTSGESILTYEDGNVNISDDLLPGWNLVGLPDTTKANLVNLLTLEGMTLDTITSFEGINPVPSFMISEIDSKKGYWLKVSKEVGVATTRDGYQVSLYTGTNASIDIESLQNTIANNTVSNLADNSIDYTNISHITISGTNNGQSVTTPYLDPSDSGFSTAIESELTSGTLSSNYQSADDLTAQSSSAAVYIYGINSGGAPYMLSSVDVYSVAEDGTKGSLIGTTSATGYLYIATKPTDGKVILEKDGFISSVQTLSTDSGASYMFITEDSGEGVFLGGGGQIADEALSATRARALSSRNGAILVPPYFTEKSRRHGARVAPGNMPISLYPDSETLSSTVLEQTGYMVNELGKVLMASLIDRSANYNASFTDVYDRASNADRDFTDFQGLIALRDLESYSGLLQDPETGDLTSEGVERLKNSTEVWIYGPNGWTVVDSNDFELKVKDGGSYSPTLTTMESMYANSRGYRNQLEGIITIDGSAMTGAYSAIAIFKEAVGETETENFITYPLQVTVKDSSGEPLINSNVRLTRGNAGVELTSTTDANGTVEFELLSAVGQNEAINLTALKSSYYTATKTLNLSDLSQCDGDVVCNNVDMTLLEPPAYATIRGEVQDSIDRSALQYSKVDLVYPIALANVQKDVTKTIDNRDVTGIEVGAVPNARYTWYIKASSTDTTVTSAAARVSQQRWIMLKSATSDQNGNFLSYNEVLGQALARPLDSDPDDLKIIPSGQFDIAVQVEHDIDSDGVYDFSELASTSATQSNLSGEEFVSANNAYGRALGYVSTSIDVEKLFADSADIAEGDFSQYDVKSPAYNDGDWQLVQRDGSANDDLEALGMSYWDSSSGLFGQNNQIIIRGDKQRGQLSVINNVNDSTPEEINWYASISASLTSADDFKLVVLQKQNDGSYKWVSSTTDDQSFDYLNDEYLTLVGKYIQDSAVHTDKRFQLRKLSRFVSDNAVLEKLAMSLEAIKDEAGITNFTLSHPTDRLFKDGFTIEAVPEIKMTYTQNDNTTTNDVTFRQHVTLDFSGQDIRDYITLGDVFVQRPALFESTQTVYADRNGMYEFPAVPMDFGEFSDGNSFLRVQGSHLGYYDSVAQNVAEFSPDNTDTAYREDVKRVDVSLQPKPVYDVTLSAVNSTDNSNLSDAVLSIDGVKQPVSRDNMRLIESDSIQTVTGSGTVENVLGGRGTNRIIRATMDGYLPVIQTIRNLNGDENVTIAMTATSDIADSLASISVANSTIDYNNAAANISLQIADKNDGSLTDSARVVAFVNGEMVNASIDRDGTIIDANLPLDVGQNTIYFEVANSKGIARSANINLEFRPDIGTVVGNVLAFTDADSNNKTDSNKTVVVDFFRMVDSQPHYVNSQVVSPQGEYIFEDITAGEAIALQAVELDNQTNTTVKRSSLVNVTVPSARTATNDLTLEAVSSSVDGVEGAPVIEYIGNISQDGSNATVQFTVSNYDNTSTSKVGLYINGRYVDLTQNMTAVNGESNSYNTVNTTVDLRPGENRIYGYAENATGDADRTVERVINNSSTYDATLFNITGPDTSHVEVFDTNGHLIAHKVAEHNSSIEFTTVPEGDYKVVVSAAGYQTETRDSVSFPATSRIDIAMNEVEETIEVPEFGISSISTDRNVYVVNEEFTASVAVVSEENSGFSYAWQIKNEDGQVLSTCNTQQCSATITQGGYYQLVVDVTKDNETKSQSLFIYVQSVSLETPPMPPQIDGIDSIY